MGTVEQLFLTLRKNWTLAVFNVHAIVNIGDVLDARTEQKSGGIRSGRTRHHVDETVFTKGAAQHNTVWQAAVRT